VPVEREAEQTGDDSCERFGITGPCSALLEPAVPNWVVRVRGFEEAGGCDQRYLLVWTVLKSRQGALNHVLSLPSKEAGVPERPQSHCELE
jgi:hypothetical protein